MDVESIYGIIFLAIVILGYAAYWRGSVKAWKEKAACTEKVTAVLKKKSCYSRRHHVYYYFEFSFMYGKHQYPYIAHTLEEPKKSDYNSYKEGEEYTIYVNPENLRHIRYRKTEWKYAFLLRTLRGLLLLTSMGCTFPLFMVNLQNIGKGIPLSFGAWIQPFFWLAVFVVCIVSINRE